MVRKKRKSPIRHRVGSHKRSGIQIGEYKRGSGRKPKDIVGTRRRRITPTVSKTPKPRRGRIAPFKATIIYIDGQTERFDISTKNYVSAVDSAMVKRKLFRPPKAIVIRGGRR